MVIGDEGSSALDGKRGVVALEPFQRAECLPDQQVLLRPREGVTVLEVVEM